MAIQGGGYVATVVAMANGVLDRHGLRLPRRYAPRSGAWFTMTAWGKSQRCLEPGGRGLQVVRVILC